jgi:hypothetical protein
MKLISGILLITLAGGAALGQNPDIVQNTKNTVNAVAKKAELDQNQALHAAGVPSKPAAGSPAKAAPPSSGSPAPSAASAPAVVPVKLAQTPAKAVTTSAQPQTVKSSAQATPPKQGAAKASGNKAPAASTRKTPATKIAIAPIAAQPKQGAQKTDAARKLAAKPAKAEQAKAEPTPKQAAAGAKSENEPAPAPAEPGKEKKTITAEGRRDPFVSPVVNRSSGPNCSTGKRCLAIDQIMVRGVVRADTGMIAVVVNSLNKAYFLKENDPVYNGYVLRITGDSVVFKETFQDRLGKESTREIVKKITTPAV